MYDSWLMTLWNLVFTAAPVFWYGVFEQDLAERPLMEYAGLYRFLLRNNRLKLKKFLLFVAIGFWEGSAAYFFTLVVFTQGPSYSTTVDMWYMGTFAYHLVMLLVTIKIAVDTLHWTFMNHLAIWGSVVVYIAFLLLYCGVYDIFGESTNTGMYYIIYDQAVSVEFWMYLVLVLTTAALPPQIIGVYRHLSRPAEWRIIQRHLSSDPLGSHDEGSTVTEEDYERGSDAHDDRQRFI